MSKHPVRNALLKTSILALPLLVLAATASAQQPQAADPTRNLTPVTDAMLKNPPPGDWLMWRRTYDAWGYSPLDQINKDNVKDLQVAWTWSLTNGATETTPIVHDGVLYIFNYADKVQALNAATGDLIWEYKRDLPAKLDRRERQQPRQAQHGDLSRTSSSSPPPTLTSSRSTPRPARWSGITPPPTGARAGAIPAARSSSTACWCRA